LRRSGERRGNIHDEKGKNREKEIKMEKECKKGKKKNQGS